jgi:signal transduction histidine kinase
MDRTPEPVLAAGPGPDGRAAAPRPLRVLHIEDVELDHQLLLAQIRRSGMAVAALRIETEQQLRHALEDEWDAVISDYNLPGFSGLEALEVLNRSGKELPFILVSGEIGEDTAVAAMRLGASDYLLKHNLTRLAPALLQAVKASRARRARRRADRELARSRERLSELAQHLQTSIEMERAAIAREIHDDVGGTLTALRFDLAWMARHGDNAEVVQRARSAMESLTHALEASQRIMHNLRPAILEQGLVPALQWMATRFEKRSAVPCVFRTSHEQLQLPPGVPLVAYRTAQEALTNISKHAQATQVRMDLSRSGGVLSLEVSDNGRGLAPDDLAKTGSFGIRGLHERASTVGGWIELSSQARGTTLILSVPLDDAEPWMDSEFERSDAQSRHDPSAWGSL